MVVSELQQEDEQSPDNLELIAGVLDQIDNLIATSNFSVSEEVSIVSHWINFTYRNCSHTVY